MLLALDPGGTTGWSRWRVHEDEPIELINHGMLKGGYETFCELVSNTEFLDEPEFIVSESFKIDGRTPSPDVTPLRIEGVLSYVRPDTEYQPNTYKSLVPDQLLRDAGFWFPGDGHDRDSARHALAWAFKNRHLPSLRKWKKP